MAERKPRAGSAPKRTGASPRPRNGLLIVAIPAFNESESVGAVIADVKASAGRLAELGLDLEVCVVDDGSTDGTDEAARAAGADRVISHGTNMGLGAAVRTGLAYARERECRIMVKLDADGQHDPADIPAVIAPILAGDADLVYGDRFPQIAYRMPMVRRWGNAAFRGLMRWLTHWEIVDSQPGFFAAARPYLRVFLIPGDYNYAQQVLLDAYHKGMRFAQVKIAFRERTAGASFVSLRYPFVAILQILMLLVSVRPLRVFLPVAAVSLLGAGAVFVVEVAMWLAGELNRPVEHPNLVLGLGVFGLNTAFFGLLAELIVRSR